MTVQAVKKVDVNDGNAAQEVHAAVRKWLAEKAGPTVAAETRWDDDHEDHYDHDDGKYGLRKALLANMDEFQERKNTRGEGVIYDPIKIVADFWYLNIHLAVSKVQCP